MIANERVKALNDKSIAPQPYVVYWMQSAQRVAYNHALAYAVDKANGLSKPLIVFFGIAEHFPEANERHFRFMLEGLRETKAELAKRRIRMLIRVISPEKGALELAHQAALMVVDGGYLRVERAWRSYLAQNAPCQVMQVETNVIVPVEAASLHEEYAARTIRPKIHKRLNDFDVPVAEQPIHLSSMGISLAMDEFAIETLDTALSRLSIDRSLKPVDFFHGGTSCAETLLADFIERKLPKYNELKNNPEFDYTSQLSPYLHFGQISPLHIYRNVKALPAETSNAFIEELLIRRELSMNFVWYNKQYDSIDSLPTWARATLDKHRRDPRPYVYTKQQLEQAATHDVFWNAAQEEMVLTGKMNGYMRMYWGKKILEWTVEPAEAYQTAIYLNNKYCLDGRDPNSYTGIAWCFGKHDRPWQERAVFGTIRYMNDTGLKRKFDMNGYLDKVHRLRSNPDVY